MNRILPILFGFIFTFQSLAQPLRYTETVFKKADTIKNVEYAIADWLNNLVPLLDEYNVHNGESKTENRPLYMDIFTPHGDTVTKRPVILFGHSGGFLIGSRHNDDMIAFCDSFARRGYVTATIDYRLGMGTRLTLFPLKIYLTEENGARAVYRAVQDSRAAVRFLKHNADTYGIDTTKIYMAGSSAGGFVALHNLYMNEPGEIPDLALTEPSLGGFDTIGIQGYGAQFDAVVSMWGALQSTELIQDEQKPVLLIHGEDDDVVYFKKGTPLESSIPDYNEISFNVPDTYGSYCIDTALNNKNVNHETYFVPGKKHEFYGVGTGDWRENGPNEYWDTIHWKISDFLFDIFKPEADFNYETQGVSLTCFDITEGSRISEWDFGDGTKANGQEVSHTYAEAGYYKVKLTTCNENIACDTLTKTIQVGAVSVENSYLSDQLKIYPNPARSTLNISGINYEHDVDIIDLTGRTILKQTNIKSERIDISTLIPGIYILKVGHNNETAVKKFQVIK
ncbi:MAG: T9SS type A sorting domain-containing protein [Bacteroidota bacterium]